MKHSSKRGHANELEWTGELAFWSYGALCLHCNDFIDISSNLPISAPSAAKEYCGYSKKRKG
jgi:hypothetical protein